VDLVLETMPVAVVELVVLVQSQTVVLVFRVASQEAQYLELAVEQLLAVVQLLLAVGQVAVGLERQILAVVVVEILPASLAVQAGPVWLFFDTQMLLQLLSVQDLQAQQRLSELTRSHL
jgi:hypothetical protein